MKNILFVCSGNTCRSPMAHALFDKKNKQYMLPFAVNSAGLFVYPGSSLSENASLALTEKGIDFSHIPKQVNKQLISNADYIFGITDSHAKALCELYPDFCDKIYSPPFDITDPYGENIDFYRKTLFEIENLVDEIIKHLSEEKDDR